MAFSTYEEFLAACADPKRVLTVYHQVFMQTAAAARVGQITPLKLWTTTSPLSAGGALLNHTSTNGSANGTLGIPIRKPFVEGRSWYLYNVEAETANVRPTQITLYDALWFGTFTSSVASVPSPALTRYADGRNVVCTLINKHSSSSTAYAGSVSAGVETYEGTPITITAGTEDGSVASSPFFATGLNSMISNVKTKPASGTGVGGVKRVTSLTIPGGASMSTTASIWLLKKLAAIPITNADLAGATTPVIKPYAALPQYLAPKPFVRLDPGTDGNYACLLPIFGKNNVPTWATTNVIYLRLQFVEG